MANLTNDQKIADLDVVRESGLENDVLAEKRMLRKLDWNLLPLFFVLCKYILK